MWLMFRKHKDKKKNKNLGNFKIIQVSDCSSFSCCLRERLWEQAKIFKWDQ